MTASTIAAIAPARRIAPTTTARRARPGLRLPTAGASGRGGGGGGRESRIVLEDPLLESPQLLARLEAELLGEQGSPSPVDVERVRLAARAGRAPASAARGAVLASGSSRTSASSSGRSSAWRPSSRSASIRCSTAEARCSSSCARSGRATESCEVGERRAAPEAQCLLQLLGASLRGRDRARRRRAARTARDRGSRARRGRGSRAPA